MHTLIEKILKIDMQLRLEIFLQGLMGKQLEKKLWKFVLDLITAARLLYVQRWKDSALPTIKGEDAETT